MSDLEQIERRLFEEARREAPSAELRAGILRRNEPNAAVGRAPSAHPVPLARRSARAGRAAVFAGVGLAAAAAVALVLPQVVAPPSDEVPRAEPTPPPRRHEGPSLPAPVVNPLPVEEEEAPRVPAKPLRPKPRSLAEQIQLLKVARQALRAGDASRALGVLDDYAAGTNSVDMSAEATLLRIEALQASGQREQAQALAERFVARAPDNPLADRARSLTSGRTEEVGMGRESNENEAREKGTTD